MSDELERVRRLCLALPEATERVSHGESAWFVKKQFAMFADHHHDDRVGVCAAAPENAQARWLDLAEIVEDAYRHIAPGRLVRLLDGRTAD